jgi:hypothetical protein
MTDEDNITDAEYNSAMEELLNTVEEDNLGTIVAGVLEFLAVRAYAQGAYYILNEDGTAVTIVATKDDVEPIMEVLPVSVRSWDDLADDVVDYLTNADPGDEHDAEAE